MQKEKGLKPYELEDVPKKILNNTTGILEVKIADGVTVLARKIISDYFRDVTMPRDLKQQGIFDLFIAFYVLGKKQSIESKKLDKLVEDINKGNWKIALDNKELIVLYEYLYNYTPMGVIGVNYKIPNVLSVYYRALGKSKAYYKSGGKKGMGVREGIFL